MRGRPRPSRRNLVVRKTISQILIRLRNNIANIKVSRVGCGTVPPMNANVAAHHKLFPPLLTRKGSHELDAHIHSRRAGRIHPHMFDGHRMHIPFPVTDRPRSMIEHNIPVDLTISNTKVRRNLSCPQERVVNLLQSPADGDMQNDCIPIVTITRCAVMIHANPRSMQIGRKEVRKVRKLATARICPDFVDRY